MCVFNIPQTNIIITPPFLLVKDSNLFQRKIFKNFDVKKLKTAYLIMAMTVFFTGIAIYAFFRNLDMVLFRFFPKPLFLDALFIPIKTDSVLTRLFLFNLPDGLWFLSGLLVIRAIWMDNPRWGTVYRSVFCAIALFIELTQIFESIPGTFDLLDLLFMGIFAFLESVYFNYRVVRKLQFLNNYHNNTFLQG